MATLTWIGTIARAFAASAGAWLWICGAAGCVSETTELSLAAPDRMRFELEIYPVLLRDCGFHACHGSTERFFQVFGPGRGRRPGLMPLDPLDPLEIEYSYQRARSMVDARDPEQSLLLRKPLSVAAGGMGHEGSDELGRNVYRAKADAGYSALAAWARGLVAVGPVPPRRALEENAP